MPRLRLLGTACLGVACLVGAALLPVTATAAPPSGPDPAVIQLLQREIEMLRTTVDKTWAQVRALEAKAAEDEKARAALGEVKTSLDDQQGRLTALENRLATVEAGGGAGREVLTVDGHVFIRSEYIDNLQDFDEAGGDEDLFYRQRVRLGLTIEPLDWLRVRADLQNATIWGVDGTGQSGTQNRLAFYQGYIELDVPFAPGLSVKGGRMSLSYGAERLIGPDDFRHMPRFFDGAVIRYAYAPWITVDLFGTVLRERSTPIGQDRNFFGLYATTHALEGFTFDFYTLYLSDGAPDQGRDVVTIGVRAAGEPFRGLTFDAEAAVQLGLVDTSARNDVSHLATAYFVSLDYEIPVWGKPTFGAFFSSASGDANPADDRDVDFDPLFSSQHRFWGALDLISWTNAIDFGGRLRVTPSDGLTFLVEAHRFLAVEPRGSVPGLWGGRSVATDGSIGDALGTEVDLILTWRFNAHLAIEAGYAFFLPDDAIADVLDGTDRADWAYGQVRVDL